MRNRTMTNASGIAYYYWVLLVSLCFFFSLRGYWEFTKNDITYPKTLKMGYPPYFIFSLGIAKIMGAMIIITRPSPAERMGIRRFYFRCGFCIHLGNGNQQPG